MSNKNITSIPESATVPETVLEPELMNPTNEPSFVNKTVPDSQNSSVDQSPNPNITYQELLQNQHENLKQIFTNSKLKKKFFLNK